MALSSSCSACSGKFEVGTDAADSEATIVGVGSSCVDVTSGGELGSPSSEAQFFLCLDTDGEEGRLSAFFFEFARFGLGMVGAPDGPAAFRAVTDAGVLLLPALCGALVLEVPAAVGCIFEVLSAGKALRTLGGKARRIEAAAPAVTPKLSRATVSPRPCPGIWASGAAGSGKNSSTVSAAVARGGVTNPAARS